MTDTRPLNMNERIDVIRRAEQLHMIARAASKEARGGEEWVCKCGAQYRGDGAIERGRRHAAQEVLIALDDAGVSA
jgi:hypothetical protein